MELSRGCSDIVHYDRSHNEEGRMTDEMKLRKRASEEGRMTDEMKLRKQAILEHLDNTCLKCIP